jgi:hypothetical protein
MRRFPSGCFATMAVVLALLFGSGGGCLIGATMTPPHAPGDNYAVLGWMVNGAVIGAALGLIGGLLATCFIVPGSANSPGDDD